MNRFADESIRRWIDSPMNRFAGLDQSNRDWSRDCRIDRLVGLDKLLTSLAGLQGGFEWNTVRLFSVHAFFMTFDISDVMDSYKKKELVLSLDYFYLFGDSKFKIQIFLFGDSKFLF